MTAGIARCVCVALASVACATAPLDDARAKEVRAVVDDVKARGYPELAKRSVALDTFEESDAFFQSRFGVLAALLGDREYTIDVNPRVFDAHSPAGPVPHDALAGVIAHELGHTWDYERRDRLGLAALLPSVIFDEDRARFERWTDLQAVARGYGPSLYRYRVWQSRVLTAEQWQRKREIYYGPHELTLLIDARARCPQVFWAFLSDPPMSTRDIATHCP